jgi:uncharacterized lipoprotein YddW (UPF0748 family)
VVVSGCSWQRLGFKLAFFRVINAKNPIALLSVLLSWSIVLTPTLATAEVLGVVKSQENARQWAEITNRLQQVGVNYCIVDTANWQRELDLGNISVLLLPNVENLTGSQAIALEQWMNRGGKVIVTGPTGNLSQPQVRSQLRSLFGAYWGFSLSSPSTLELSTNTPSEWYDRPQLSHTFIGGAVIPANVNSQTAAVWLANGTPAAAVITNNSTFLGWRWGVDTVAPASMDTAWLQASLNRYGISTYGQFNPEGYQTPTACRPNSLTNNESRPFLPGWQIQPPPLQQSNFNLVPQPSAIAPEQAETMTQELEGLINRFASTLLTADAHASNIENSTEKVIEQVLSQQTKGNTYQSSNQQFVSTNSIASTFSQQTKGNTYQSSNQQVISLNSKAHQALKEAKSNLKKFHSLLEQRDYLRAKREWQDTRRSLWDNYPTDRQVAQPEIRAIWLDRGTIVKARSESDLAKIFDRLATAGINTVFFETINAGYTIYPSRIAPQQNPLVRGWDPLEAAVKLAHERNMELHAWVWAFAAGNQRHNLILNLPQDYLGPILSRYPDWVNPDQEGNKFHYNSGKVFLDPANPGVRRYLSLLLEEIATRYKVDGIQLDYIRYPFQSHTGSKSYGYGIAARQQFQQLTGVDPVKLQLSAPLWSQWTGFRIKQIDSFVATVSQDLKQKRPDLILSTAVFPMPRQQRLDQIQQHWEEWIRQGWIDLLVPMTYAMDTTELEKLASPLWDASSKGSALLLPGIRLLNLPDVVAVDQMQLLRGMPTEGYALFAAENFNSNLEQIFSRTQGRLTTQTQEPLPHRQPFQATVSRYQNLQKEWNFALSNNQLVLDEISLKQWAKKADNLALNLQQLADEPSQKHFLSAQLALNSFRRDFPEWMEADKTISAYQVEVWQNRLDTLNRLLSYGERRVLNQTPKITIN